VRIFSSLSSERKITGVPHAVHLPSAVGGLNCRWKTLAQVLLGHTRRPMVRATMASSSLSTMSTRSMRGAAILGQLEQEVRLVRGARVAVEHEALPLPARKAAASSALVISSGTKRRDPRTGPP